MAKILGSITGPRKETETMKSYITRIRAKLGHDPFIHPAARIIIENPAGEILFIERRDNGKLGIPAGSLEENETIAQCIKREVKEETGLSLLDMEVIGISTHPLRETVTYPNQDRIQYFTIEFYSQHWSGDLKVADTQEVKRATFMARSYIAQLPENEVSAFESLDYYREHGRVMLK